jgi:hypothetical protein
VRLIFLYLLLAIPWLRVTLFSFVAGCTISILSSTCSVGYSSFRSVSLSSFVGWLQSLTHLLLP